MKKFEISSHNMLFSLNATKWAEDLAVSSKGEITAYQEAGGKGPRTALRQWCNDHGRGLFMPDTTGQPISWRATAFTPVANSQGVIEVHRGAKAMGVDAHMKPARDFSYLGLKERETGSQGLIINVHPISTATAKESQVNHPQGAEVNIWNDWSIGQYWLDVVSFTAGAMSQQNPGRTEREGKWDWICIVGDFNAAMDNDRRWYYPGSLLLSLCDQDKRPAGLDHIVFTKGSDLDRGQRWAEDGHTDHKIHFQTVTLTGEQSDFPREL